MKKLLTLLLVILMAIGAFAQSSLKGKIVDEATGKAVVAATITLANQNLSTTTNQNGEFFLQYLQAGDEELIIEADGFNGTVELIQVAENQAKTLDDILLKPDVAKEAKDEILLNIADNDLNDDEGKSQEQSSATSSSLDVFNNVTSWAWSTARYRNRGYTNNYETTYIEGISFNTAERGQFSFSSMGGLNDATRYKETNQAIEANNYSFGGLGNATNYLMSATNYAQGWKVSAAGTNRNYKAAVRATYSSGLLANGWAFAAQVAFRFSPYTEKKGQIGEGINYYSLGYFFTAEKRWGDRHKLNIITFGAPTMRGQSGAVTQEVYDLTNQYNKTQWGWNNYNPYWGYQDGKMRNSRIVHSYDPTLIVGYTFNINEFHKLHIGVGYHYSLYSNSALSFNNAPDPRPDYYRNLPSFLRDGQIDANGNYITKSMNDTPLGDGFTDPDGNFVGASIDKKTYMDLYDAWTSRDNTTTQINWDAIYAANRANNIINPDGTARYIQERRHNNIQEAMVSANYQNTTVDQLFDKDGNVVESISGKKEGIDFQHNKWISCAVVASLLGAVSALFDKYLLGSFNNMFVQAWSNFYQLALMTAVLFVLWWPGRNQSTPFQWKWSIVLIAVFLTMADYAYFYSLTLDGAMISVVSMIRRSSVVVSFLCGAMLFKEKNLKSKAIDLVLVLIGLAFLLIGSMQ